MADKKKIIESISDQEQRTFIKFALLMDWNVGLTHKKMKALIGKKCLSLTTIKYWFKKFQSGDTEVKEGRGGPRKSIEISEKRVAEILSLFEESRAWSIRSISNRLGIPKSTVHGIIRDDLKMIKKLGKWIPYDLTPNQAIQRIESCKTNLLRLSKDRSLLKRTFTVDETWASLYMSPDRSQQRFWLKKGEQAPTLTRENIHGQKRLLIMAMDIDGICFWKLLEPNKTVDGETYKNFLEEKVATWLMGKNFIRPILLQDNARPHKSKLVMDFLAGNKISTWEHPPYSPDISPLDFNCFSQLKRKLRGKKHVNWEEFIRNLEVAVAELNDSGFMKGVESLPERWGRVIEAKGHYI